MRPSSDVISKATSGVMWLARTWAAVAVVVLAAFFVEHLSWFRDASHLPSLSVFVAQAFQLLLIVGLVLGWRRELSGAGVVLLGAVGFVLAAGGGSRLVSFIGLMSVPAVLWFAHAWLMTVVVREGQA